MEKTLMALAAAAAIAAAAAVSVVAAAFALYALVMPYAGPAGAGAIVAAVAAFVVFLAGLMAARKVEGRRAPGERSQPDPGIVQKIVEIARDHPMLSMGAAVAAGVYALKNPSLVAAVVRAFMDQGPRKPG